MSAIKQLQAELEQFPIEPGGELPPMLRAGPGAAPTGFILVVLELIARVEALEATVDPRKAFLPDA